jgi:CHAT domain-containing protein
MRNAILLTFCLLALLTSQPVLRAQTPAPSPQSAEATRVDQLITECRELMMKGSFEGITEKGEEALKLSQKLGDKVRQSRSLMYVALGMFHTGRTEEAIEPFKQSAALAAEAGDKALQTRALNAAGVLLEEAGRLEEALYFFTQSLVLAQELKDRPNEATALRNIGRIHTTNRNYSQANEALQRSLEISRQLQDQPLEHGALNMLARLENERKNFELALNYETRTHQLEGPKISPSAKYQTLTEEAITLYRLGNLEKCNEVLLQALAFARSQKILAAEASILGNLAELQIKQDKHGDALISASQSLAILQRIGGDPVHEAAVLYTTAQAQRRLGKSDDALASLGQAITLLEKARVLAVPTEAARAQLSARNNQIFADAISLLLERGKVDEALAVSESYHGRAFLDSLVESRADLQRVLPKEMVERENALLNQISKIQRDLWQEGISPEREQNLKNDLAAAEDALEQFQLQVRHSNPQYANLKHLAPLTVARIQGELLDTKTALIEYVVGDEKSFAWLVTKDKVFFAALPPANELNRLVTDYRKSIAEKSDGGKPAALHFNAQSRELYRALVQPFEANLSSQQRLIIVPDGALTYLPFETLMDRKGYLVERFAIGYEPSASALAAIRAAGSQPGSRGIVAFGDPAYHDSDVERERSARANSRAATVKYYAERGLDLRRLPYTRAEVNTISALFPIADRKVFLGLDANEMRVKSESLERYRYVHFATHGIVDEETPARSGVILSLENNDKEDGILQTTEIMRLKLNADLVTLSACRTGLGKVVAGEGVLGLTRAFMYAGSRSVVASLWNVNDTATAELMKSFYTNLKKGEPKDEALRQAKLTLLKGKQTTWRHPYYWAPFVLVGANN